MRILLLAFLFVLVPPAAAQSVPDSILRRELDSLVVVQSATARYCGTTSATQYMRVACRLLDSTIARLARQVVPAVPPPPPAPTATVSLSVEGCAPAGSTCSVLSLRPGTPYNLFLAVRVDSAGQRLADSAAVTLSDPGLANLYWNPSARRFEVFTTTAHTRVGTLVLTARRGTASDTLEISVVSPTAPTAPVTIDTTRFADPVDSIGVWLSRDTLALLPDTTTGCALVRAAGRWYLAATAIKVHASQASATQYRFTAGMLASPTHCRYLTTPRSVTLDSLFPVRWVVDSIGVVGPTGQFETREALGARAGFRRALAPFQRAR